MSDLSGIEGTSTLTPALQRVISWSAKKGGGVGRTPRTPADLSAPRSQKHAVAGLLGDDCLDGILHHLRVALLLVEASTHLCWLPLVRDAKVQRTRLVRLELRRDLRRTSASRAQQQSEGERRVFWACGSSQPTTLNEPHPPPAR
jgi:hypothetical protein